MITEEVARTCVPPRGFLNSWVTYGYHATDCNFAYHILGGLMLIAQTFPPHLSVSLGSRTYGNIYGLVIGESTESRKTTAIKLARELAQEVWREACPMVVGPGSASGLIDRLVEAPRMLVAYDEFGDFLHQASRGQLAELKTKYTELYDSGPAGRLLSNKRDRHGNMVADSRVVQNPRLSIMGAVNQSYLEDFTEPNDWTGGFLARFLTMVAHRERTYVMPDAQPAMYRKCFDELLQFVDLGLAPGPCEGLDVGARDVWDAWNVNLRRLRANNVVHQGAEASISRAGAMALKIALLVMWDIGGIRQTRDVPWRLNAESMWYGCAIANLHIHSVITLLPSLAGSPDQRAMRDLVRHVAKAGAPLTFGQICDRAGITKRRALELCESLCEMGRLKRVTVMGGRVQKYAVGVGADTLAVNPEAAHEYLANGPAQPLSLEGATSPSFPNSNAATPPSSGDGSGGISM